MSSSPTPTNPSDTPIDPVTGLYKMSRTAGVGLQDYAEINPFAVGALVLGMSSWLVFFANLFYVVPLIGLLLGVWAIIRILGSNGTQTGLLVAGLGILLSAGTAGYAFFTASAAAQRDEADRVQIRTLIGNLSTALSSGQFEQAYALFDPRFRERVKLEEFSDRWRLLQSSPLFGTILDVTDNNLINIDPAAGDQQRAAETNLVFTVRSDGQEVKNRQRAVFVVDSAGQWFLLDIPTFFPAEVNVVNPPRTPGA